MYKNLFLACSLLSGTVIAAEQAIPEAIIKKLISSVLKQSYPHLEAATLIISLTKYPEYDESSLPEEMALMQSSEIFTQKCSLATATDSYDATLEYRIFTLKKGIIPFMPVYPVYAGTIRINEHIFPFHASTNALQVKEAAAPSTHATPLTSAEIEEIVSKTESLAETTENDGSIVYSAMAQFCLDKYRETKNIKFLILSKEFLTRAKEFLALENEMAEQNEEASEIEQTA